MSHSGGPRSTPPTGPAGWSERGRRGSPRGDHRGISPGIPVLFERSSSWWTRPCWLPFAAQSDDQQRRTWFIRPGAATQRLDVAREGRELCRGHLVREPARGRSDRSGPTDRSAESWADLWWPGPIPIPHSLIRFNDLGKATLMSGPNDEFISTVVVHYGWQEVGELVDVPATADQPTSSGGLPPAPPAPPEVPAAADRCAAAQAVAGVDRGRDRRRRGGLDRRVRIPKARRWYRPCERCWNLLPVSRGQTVTGEILGSGDSILINQEFVLASSPLTYLTDHRSAVDERVSEHVVRPRRRDRVAGGPDVLSSAFGCARVRDPGGCPAHPVGPEDGRERVRYEVPRRAAVAIVATTCRCRQGAARRTRRRQTGTCVFARHLPGSRTRAHPKADDRTSGPPATRSRRRGRTTCSDTRSSTADLCRSGT